MKKTAVITGASRGIGRAAALLFAENGYDLALCCRHNANLLQQTANQARQLGAVCLTYTGDMGDPDSCAGFFKEIDDTFSSIDVLINNAGGAETIPAGSFAEMPVEYWDRQIRMNLSCAAYCSRIAIGDMLAKGTQGRIINISSVHSQVTWVKRKALPYCAGKAGMNMFTKALGVEVARHGIRVNCIAPGFIKTQLTTRYTQEQVDAFERKIPSGILGRPEDIVPMALLLADEEKARFIVGQTFVIDGGQSIDGAIDSMMYDF